MPCTSDTAQTCGGAWRNSVYSTGQSAPVPVPPPPPPTGPVGDCGALPAAGKWERVTSIPSSKELVVLNVVMDPIDRTVVYATVDKDGIYKSTNCGSTWTKLNTGRNGATVDSGSSWVFMIDPTNNQIMYTSPLYGDNRLLKSVDGGASWDSLFAPGGNVERAQEYMFTQGLAIDTADHHHLVVSFHVNCVAPYRPVCLAESQDGGSTWQIINGPPQMGNWVEDAGPVVIHGEIFFAVPFDGLFHTGDHGNTWTKVAPQGYMHIYRAADGYYYMGSAQLALQRSSDLMSWATMPGTPTTVSSALLDDGQRLLVAARYHPSFVSSPMNDLAHWTDMPGPPGGEFKAFAYDANHRVLYSANVFGGLLRMVLP